MTTDEMQGERKDKERIKKERIKWKIIQMGNDEWTMETWNIHFDIWSATNQGNLENFKSFLLSLFSLSFSSFCYTRR